MADRVGACRFNLGLHVQCGDRGGAGSIGAGVKSHFTEFAR